MNGNPRHSRRSLLAPLATGLSLALAATAAHAESAAVGYPRDAGTVVVSVVEVLGELAEADAGPSLEIYGDGRVAVHYPAYMKRAGNWAGRLGRAELDSLVQSLADKGVRGFDTQAVGNARRAAAAARRAAGASLFHASDPSLITITLRTDEGESRAAWTGLREDARAYPEIAALRNLAAAHGQLRAIMERGDLARAD